MADKILRHFLLLYFLHERQLIVGIQIVISIALEMHYKPEMSIAAENAPLPHRCDSKKTYQRCCGATYVFRRIGAAPLPRCKGIARYVATPHRCHAATYLKTPAAVAPPLRWEHRYLTKKHTFTKVSNMLCSQLIINICSIINLYNEWQSGKFNKLKENPVL